ncbi:MAG: AAA family ATPase, partial [Polyangiales bacterium]
NSCVPIALKRLLRGTRGEERMTAMFEGEYQTLASLRHPGIVEVYDYGVDAAGAYYTMELLDGKDVRELSPLPFREACRYLRDVASALALLHARRLLHRDLSPRNVRVAADGRCKLFDFGALATFGISGEVVGTAPCVPPEALRGAPLDQRSDLYALGALGYFMLSGRHAFPASDVRELPTCWQNELVAPSEALARSRRDGREAPRVPRDLDRLLLSLLSLDPLARPSTAAEVIDRINVIAHLDAEPLPDVSLSYLAFARLAGRDAELERLQSALERAQHGRGACVGLGGPRGIGSSRLLGEISVRAQLAGALCVRVDGAVSSGPYGAARELCKQLVDMAPDDAVAAAQGRAEVLARFSPVLRTRLGVTPSDQRGNAPGEGRKRTQAALRAFICELAARRGLLLVVDNAEQVDEASAVLLARLAHDAPRQRLLLCVAWHDGEIGQASAAVRLLAEGSEALRLRELDPAQTAALAVSLFGQLANVRRLAQWLHERTAGNPGACIDLCEHLVRERVIRHLDGTWVIPGEIAAGRELQSVQDAMQARLSRLSRDALGVAEALSIERGQMALELCVALARGEGVASPFGGIEELAAHGFIVASTETGRFAEEGLRDQIIRGLGVERLRQLHLRLAELMMERGLRSVDDRLRAGFHLLHGGDEGRGADLLARAGLELVYDSDEMPSAAPALEAALAVYRKLGRSLAEQARLLGPLAIAGYHTDFRLAQRYGAEATAALGRLVGLDLAQRLRPWLGRKLSLYVGLATAALRFTLSRRARREGSFGDAVVLTVQCAFSQVAVAALCLDTASLRTHIRPLEALSALGRRHAGGVVHELARGLLHLIEDRPADATAGLRGVLQVLEHERVRALDGAAHALNRGGVLYALGVLAGFRDGAEALRRADALEGIGLRLYDLVAEQVRANFYANRGEIALAEAHRERVELYALDTGSSWQAEVWAPSAMMNAYIITRDVLGIKRTAQQLAQLAEEIPSLRLFARLAEASYRLVRGDARGAIELIETILSERPPRSFIGWAGTCGSLAWAYNMVGEHARAKAVCQSALTQLAPEDLDYVALCLRVEVQLAMAEAGLGQPADAERRLDALIDRHQLGGGPVTLGMLHEFRARLALQRGDKLVAGEQLEAMVRYYASTGNPALIALCERFAAESQLKSRDTGPPVSVVDFGDAQPDTEILLHGCVDAGARAERALALLLGSVRAQRGYLYAVEEGGMQLLAPLHGDEPPPDLELWVRAQLDSNGDSAVTVVDDAQSGSRPHASRALLPRRLCELILGDTGCERLVGVAVVEAEGSVWAPPPRELLRGIARGLWERDSSQLETARVAL